MSQADLTQLVGALMGAIIAIGVAAVIRLARSAE